MAMWILAFAINTWLFYDTAVYEEELEKSFEKRIKDAGKKQIFICNDLSFVFVAFRLGCNDNKTINQLKTNIQ